MAETISDINLWLKESLEQQNLKDIFVKPIGSSAKGDGFVGDIAFVQVSAVDAQTQQKKQLDLVLKCSKLGENFRNTFSVQTIFLNEIHVYEKVFPTFNEFQLSKNVKNSLLFNCYPKFVGKYTTDTREIIILENLKSEGYVLWPRDVALPIDNLIMVVREYGKFHAISVAMQEQQPLEFENLTKNMPDSLREILKNGNISSVAINLFDETYNLFQGMLDNELLEKWITYKSKVNYIYNELREPKNGLKVVLHGDCWNNNFMWKLLADKSPEKVAIIDWQISFVSNPMLDLGYFLFTCISPEGIANLDKILICYYETFSAALREMKCDPEKLYPKSHFEKDWKTYSSFGLVQGILASKMACTDNVDLPDLSESVEKNEELTDVFNIKVSRMDGYKARIMPMIKYAVENKLFE